MSRTDSASRVVHAEPARVFAALLDPDSLVPGVRVVQAVDFVSDDERFAGTMTMTWELSEENDGTKVRISADDVPSGITAEDHAAGMASTLANLASFVEGGPG
jgi:uncharacterized protein YndB with AHSA1/START domain